MLSELIGMLKSAHFEQWYKLYKQNNDYSHVSAIPLTPLTHNNYGISLSCKIYIKYINIYITKYI